LYRHSPRLTVELGAQGYHSETINPDERSDDLLKRRLLQRTDSLSAFSDVHYGISPGTEVGVEVNVRHTDSDYARANYLSTEATLTQKLGRRWTVALTGGAGAIRGLSGNPNLLLTRESGSQPLWVAGVDVRYAGRSQRV
jgi:hypothetical protein